LPDDRRAEELAGYWWRPEAPRERIAGTLTIQASGEMLLDLLGRFSLLNAEAGVAYPIDESFDCLCGEIRRSTIEGVQKATLWGCGWRGGLLDLVLQPSVAVIGEMEVGDAETARFPGALVEFSGLPEWAGRTRPTLSIDDAVYPRHLVLEYNATDPVRIEHAGDSVTLQHVPAFSVGESTRLEDTPAFVLEFAEPCSFTDVIGGQVRALQHFMTFALDSPATISGIRVHVADAESPRGYQSMRAYFRQAPDLPDDPPEFRANRMLFTRRQAGDDRLPTILRRWFTIVAEIETVIDVHLAARYRPRIYGETRFLFAVQALEALHRGRPEFDSTVEARSKFNAWRDGILSRLGDADRARVSGLLRNDKSFRGQLDEIFDAVPVVIGELKIDRDELARRAVKARNEIVHTLPRTEDADGLYRLTETLRWVMNGYLLAAIGFTAGDIRGLLHQNLRASAVASWWIRPDA